MNIPENVKKVIFIVVGLACLTPWIGPPVALFLGILLSQTIGHPFIKFNSKATKLALQISVVGLGFGMNLSQALEAGQQGFIFTVVTISTTLILGLVLGRLMKIKRNTSVLISSGTAICGGSAIAAVSPVVGAKEDEMSVSLATVFVLNAIALFIFPSIGTELGLTQEQFGIWSAIAIHDTSSVVGASAAYGEEALQIATTIKLSRALWIIPLTIIMAMFIKGKSKIKIPYFILYFVLAIVVNTYVPLPEILPPNIVIIAKKGLTITLFLIGAGLTRKALKSLGVKPLILGVSLWVFISVVSLMVILKAV